MPSLQVYPAVNRSGSAHDDTPRSTSIDTGHGARGTGAAHARTRAHALARVKSWREIRWDAQQDDAAAGGRERCRRRRAACGISRDAWGCGGGECNPL